MSRLDRQPETVAALREARAALHDASVEIERLRAENAELRAHNDPASYSSMVYWREKCYEAREAPLVLRQEIDHLRLLLDAERQLRNTVSDLRDVYQTRLERAEEAARRIYGTALLIREHGCRPERVHAILNEIEEAFPTLAAAQPEKPCKHGDTWFPGCCAPKEDP